MNQIIYRKANLLVVLCLLFSGNVLGFVAIVVAPVLCVVN